MAVQSSQVSSACFWICACGCAPCNKFCRCNLITPPNNSSCLNSLPQISQKFFVILFYQNFENTARKNQMPCAGRQTFGRVPFPPTGFWFYARRVCQNGDWFSPSYYLAVVGLRPRLCPSRFGYFFGASFFSFSCASRSLNSLNFFCNSCASAFH